MDGLQLLAEVTRRFPYLPIMMVTAYGDDERRRRADELGTSKFITKPVDFDLLKEHFAPAVRIGELTERGESAARRLTSALDEYVQKPRANVRFTAGRKIRWRGHEGWLRVGLSR